MALEVYRKKRNFQTTPEPKGRLGKPKQRALSYVIQKHAASHMHYDVRLELNGVLLSWAVPKGPSLDPRDKRLAIHVEDHPLEYGGFEGVIPPKQYGSGTVLLWDRGIWLPKEDPQAGLARGKLKFELQGEKLHGGWTLVRSHGGKYDGEKAWLLIKEDDAYANRAESSAIVEKMPDSVASGRALDQIAADADRVWHSNKSVAENVELGATKTRAKPKPLALAKVTGAKKSAMPAMIAPQLATLVKQAPAGAEWLHEIKFDGYRMLGRIENGEARMISRSGKDWTENFATLADAIAQLPVNSVWLDGEVVVLGTDGRSSFQALQNALSGAVRAQLHYIVFDLLYCDGFDLAQVPLIERKRLLQALLRTAHASIRLSTHVKGSGPQFFQEACKLGLEGSVAKMAGMPYRPGRSRDWLKIKCAQRQEMVIGGYTNPAGSRTGFGALLLGVYETDGSLRYSGKVGTGFDEATLASVYEQLVALAQEEAPFRNPPKGAEARRAHWVKPALVAEVAFAEWTKDGTLRHPSFQGLRADKSPREVVRERPANETKTAASTKAAGTSVVAPPAPKPASKPDHDTIAGVRLSNPAKLLYPEDKLSKRDLAVYYESVGEHIVPHLKNRPLTLLRCPDGWESGCFVQKNVDAAMSKLIDRVAVTTSDGPATYMMANSIAAVVALLQLGALELHPWGAAKRKLGCPDRMIFDLDPDEGLPWKAILDAVRVIKALLDHLGLQGFLRTTGGKGLHVVVPLSPVVGWESIKGFSQALAVLLTATFPDRFTAKMSKVTRRGKIFIDYLRNSEGATAIASYSLRARAHAPVAVPIDWNELDDDPRFDHFNLRNVPARLKALKHDPWAEFFKVKQAVTAGMMQKVDYVPQR